MLWEDLDTAQISFHLKCSKVFEERLVLRVILKYITMHTKQERKLFPGGRCTGRWSGAVSVRLFFSDSTVPNQIRGSASALESCLSLNTERDSL